MIQHKCIKCSTPYEDEDIDAYLCSTCNQERLRIAAEIDAKYPPNRIKEKPMSELEQFEAQAHVMNNSRGEKIYFMKVRL